TAPASASVAEASPLTVGVQAADPDGQAITSLTADLSGLPAGNNAVFTPGPGNTSGALTWTPTYNDAGSYTVRFTAANALSGSAATVITVSNVDRAPVVSAPASVIGSVGSLMTVAVKASDPDGQAITSLTADLSGLPAGNNASFTPGPGDTTGTFTWTPASGQAGSYTVGFAAANALAGSSATAISVTTPNQPPVATLTASPSTGNEPLSVTLDASGSGDPDGAIASYRFDCGDGTVVGPQPGATTTHVFASGNWLSSVTVTDNNGAVASASQAITVAAVGSGPNLVGNPSFEVN